MAKGAKEEKPKLSRLALIVAASLVIGIIIGFYASGMAEKKDDTKEKMREMFPEFLQNIAFEEKSINLLENYCDSKPNQSMLLHLILFRSETEAKIDQGYSTLYIYCDKMKIISDSECNQFSSLLSVYDSIFLISSKTMAQFLNNSFTNQQKLCDLAGYIRNKDYEAIKKLRNEIG